jgi:hypothetical protein
MLHQSWEHSTKSFSLHNLQAVSHDFLILYMAPNQKKSPSLRQKISQLQIYKLSWKEYTFYHGSRWETEPRLTVLAKTSSNVLLHYSTSCIITKRGPLSLVSTIEELLGRKSSCCGLENLQYCRRDPMCWSRKTLYPQKLALTSPTSGGRSVGIIRSRTRTTEFVLFYFLLYCNTEGTIPVTWLSWLPGEWRKGNSCSPRAIHEQSYITEQAEQVKCECCLPLELVEQGLAVMSEDSDLVTKHLHDVLTRRQGTLLLLQ